MKQLMIMVSLASLLPLSTMALAQTCHPDIPLQKPNSRYAINAAANGTVTDKVTGLVWMTCSLGQAYQSSDGGCSGTASGYNWKEALVAAQTVNASSDQMVNLGFSDWRLPSVAELRSLVEKACSAHSINVAVFPSTSVDDYWSSSPYANYDSQAWNVNFYDGIVGIADKGHSDPVRLVRGGQ